MNEAELRMYFEAVFAHADNERGFHYWEICVKIQHDVGMQIDQKEAKKVLDKMVDEGKITYGTYGVYYPSRFRPKRPQYRSIDDSWADLSAKT